MPKLKKRSARQRNAASKSHMQLRRRKDDEGNGISCETLVEFHTAATATNSETDIDTLIEPAIDTLIESVVETLIDSAIDTFFKTNTVVRSCIERSFDATSFDAVIDTVIDPCSETSFDATIDTVVELCTATSFDVALNVVIEPCETSFDAAIDTVIEPCETSFDATVVELCSETCFDATIDTVIEPSIETSFDAANFTVIEPSTETSFDAFINAVIEPSTETSFMESKLHVAETPCLFTEQPFNEHLLRFGSFHQADHIFGDDSRGSQCTVNALCSIVHANYLDLKQTENIDSILIDGDSMYNDHISMLKQKGLFVNRLLNFDELPDTMFFRNKHINIQKGETTFGVCTDQFADCTLPSLHQALFSILDDCSDVLVMVGAICSSVMKKGDSYCFFDSHSHGLDGLSSPDGKAMFAVFNTFQDLLSYMYALYDSMMIDLTSPVEILPIHFKENSDLHGLSARETRFSYNSITEKEPNLDNRKLQTIKTTIGHQSHISNICEDYTEILNTNDQVKSESSVQIGSLPNSFAVEKQDENLLKKYFEDQKIREATKKKKAQDRKMYMRKYMQQKRQALGFKEMEKGNKRKKRKRRTFKKKEIVYQKESKQSARKTVGRKEKEKELKHLERQSDEFKKREIVYQRESKQAARKTDERKEKENELKQLERQSDEFKEREIVYQRESKQAARKTDERKEKEKELKQLERQSDEFKEKEIVYQRESKQEARKTDERKEKEKELKQLERQSDEFKEREILYQRESKQAARKTDERKEKEFKQLERQSDEFKEREIVYQRESKQAARKTDERKEKEKELKQLERQSDEFKEKEIVYQRESKQEARKTDERKEKEKELKQLERQSDEFKEKEIVYQRESKQEARKTDERKEKEKELKQLERQSDEFKEREIVYQRESKQAARESDEFKAKEIIYQKESKQNRRKSSEFKQKEKELKQAEREDVDFQQKELTYQRNSKRRSRKQPLFVEEERIIKQMSRVDSRNKKEINMSDKQRKAAKRNVTSFHEEEHLRVKRRKYGVDVLTCIEKFHKNVSVGPIYVCSSCHQTWFKQSVSKANSLPADKQNKYLTNFPSVDGKIWICITCKANILHDKVPRMSTKNGMNFPCKPPELELFPLEERLISLRIPFMQIRELPRGRQYSVKGNVVNVPTDIQPVVNALPRPLDENVVIPVKLKKRLSYSSCAFTENVRPLSVLVALHWLIRSSDLYKDANIDIDEDWERNITNTCLEVCQEFVSQTDGKQTTTNDTATTKSSHQNTLNDSDEEENQQENVGNVDTLLDYDDLENRTDTFTFAPGEGQTPVSIYQDVHSESLCFPTIFCGQRRIENTERIVPVNYSDVAKWELRSHDRRCANCVPNIFFKLKKIQMKQLNDKVHLAIRQCQLNGKQLTVEQAKNPHYTEDFVRKDQGYFIFNQLRNSPAYLETKKKDVFAMIRQLGLPTWFMSLSSADTRWTDLLKMLSRLNNSAEYTDEEIMNLTWEEKIKLVQKDPVTCSRYFDHRVQEFLKIVLKSDHAPIGPLTDYFYRVEFQQRGSPHIHMLVWVDGAPKYKQSSNKDITDFVNKYLTCCSGNEDVADLIQLQTHKHSRTCRKKENKVCRFGYPLPPLPKTMVLEPLEADIDKYKKLFQSLQTKMNDEKDGFDMSYNEFLENVVKLNEGEYLKCIRSSITSAKVFLERSPKDIRVNYYNKIVLMSWKANMDMQFVLDPYACAMYIVSYISKSQRGMSALMHAASEEAKQGNLDIKRQVRHVGNVFSNSVEVSAQEAVYLVLQMPLTRSSRDVVFINTSPGSKRVQLLKSQTALEELPSNSTDVVADNSIKRYAKRPKCIEKFCLADYMSELEIVYPKEENTTMQEINDDDLAEEEQLTFDSKSTIVKLKNGIVIRRRKTQKVIRYVRFNKNSKEEDHYREKLLLFHPWRNEEKDLLGGFNTYKSHYDSLKRMIDVKVKHYEHHTEELDLARDLAEQDQRYDEIAPGTQEEEALTEQGTAVESETFIHFNPDKAANREYDIGIEIGSACSSATIEPKEHMLADDDYRALLRSLNCKQKHFYNHVVHWLKTKDEPLFAFLTGGAGVGKSVVIKALYQTLYRMLNLKEGENSDDIRILLCAFTGKAAYNINGSTISSSFMEKFKQANQTLGCDQLNTFRSKFRNLSVIIIDEISMVSNRKLSFIDQRLQALTGTKLPFGGKSIIAVGDLYQLKPVADTWIFEDLSRNLSSLSPNLWKDHFTIFDLTEVMRQKDDLPFAELLNRLRHNNMTADDREKIAKCSTTPTAENYPAFAPHIFAENYFMDIFNAKMIANLDAEKVTVDCHDSVVGGNISKEKQNYLLSKVSSDSCRTMGLHRSLTVVVGMIYDVTINLDTEDGLNNGSPCVVKSIEYKQTGTSRPSIIWVKFDDIHVGAARRKKYQKKGFYHDCIDIHWTPIFDVEQTFSYNRHNIQRIQFPLQPSAGRSVYRAQGTTLDQLVVDLTQRKTRKIPHLHYVALSRVRSICNLHIVNFNERALQLDEKVVHEMKRLTDTASLKLCYVPLDTVDSSKNFKVAFNNCRSLHKHIDDVRRDQSIQSAHVVAFAESRLCSRDNDEDYLISGFTFFRNDQSATTGVRPAHGLAVYVKSGIKIVRHVSCSEAKFEFTLLHLKMNLVEKQIVTVYKAPSLSFTALRQAIMTKLYGHIDKSKDLVIQGDFNIDIDNQNSLSTLIREQFSCEQLIQGFTTDYGSTLDLVFANYEGVSGVVEAYWSDHKIIYFHSTIM